MKYQVVFVALILSSTITKANETSISGKFSLCPNETTSYTISMDNPETFWQAYIEVWNGIILDNNSTSITLPGPRINSINPTVTVRWNNQAGAVGTIRAVGRYYSFGFPCCSDSEEKEIIIGSPEIGNFTAIYTASCGEDRSAYTIGDVRGATSYQWNNTLGWSWSGGGTTKIFTSNSSVLSGTVSVTAINANCPSTNSTRTISVSRESSIPFISGPDVVQSYFSGDFTTVSGSNFYWTPPTGWQCLDSQGNPYMRIQAPSYSSWGYLGVDYIDACGIGGSASKFISTESFDQQIITNTDKDEEIVQISPNPAHQDISVVAINNQDCDISIFNDQGELVKSIQLLEEKRIATILGLKYGKYIVIIKQGQKNYAKRLIVN